MESLRNIGGIIAAGLFTDEGLSFLTLLGLILCFTAGVSTGLAFLVLPTLLILVIVSFLDFHNDVVTEIRDSYEAERSAESRDSIDDL